jgi:hypothetical protein
MKKVFVLAFLAMFILACSFTAPTAAPAPAQNQAQATTAPTEVPNAIAATVQAQNQMGTFVAQTLAAQQPAATNTPVLPSATPTQLYLQAQVKASKLYLRLGPDMRFENIADSTGYPNGQNMIIMGKDHTGQWFEVKAPDGTIGWAYIQWLDLPSDSASIPTASIIPPTPTPVCVYVRPSWSFESPYWDCK